tara:strand:+ start:385 stop:591 length:207 start_codon:yes stop_codon:yes gene_type:complete
MSSILTIFSLSGSSIGLIGVCVSVIEEKVSGLLPVTLEQLIDLTPFLLAATKVSRMLQILRAARVGIE